MRIRDGLRALAMILFLFCIDGFAQGICVPDTFNVDATNGLSGKVMAHLDAGDAPLADISIRLVKRSDQQSIVHQTSSDKDGAFSFGAIQTGEYTLITHYKGLSDFYLDLSVSPSSINSPGSLIIWLGADFNKPCSGSYAENGQVSKCPTPDSYVADVMQSLDRSNILRMALERCYRGDGVHYGWMDEAIKRAKDELIAILKKNKRSAKGTVYMSLLDDGRLPIMTDIPDINYGW